MTAFKRKAIGEKPRIVETAPEPMPENKPANKREGQQALTTYLDRAAVHQWKILAVEQRMTLTDLMREAMNMVFEKYGKPPIA